MAHIRSTQASFAGGIVSRELWSRTDFSKLSSCVSDSVNFKLRPSGSASYRSGTKFLGVAGVPSGETEERLYPFVFTREDCGILEFFVSSAGELTMRFMKNKQYVTNEDGSVYEFKVRTTWGEGIENPYTYDSENLKNLSIVHKKNTVYICGPDLVPTYIERKQDNEWTQDFIQLGLSSKLPQPTSVDVTPSQRPDPTVQFDKYYWGATVVLENGTESGLTRSNAVSADVELPEQPCTIRVVADFSNMTEEERESSQVFIYRVSAGVMYFIYALRYQEGTGDVNAREFTLKDVGFSVDKSHTEPVVFKAFRGISNTAPVFTDDTPTVCAIYKQRLILAASKNEPNRFWLSKIANMDDFTYRVSVTDEMAFDRELDSGDEDKIVGFVPMDDLLCGTQSKIWRITGSTSSTMSAFIETYDGMRSRPLVSKKSILYLNGVSDSLNNFLYSEQQGGYVGEELDLLSKELFDGYKIIDFDLQNYPVQSVYALRSDNKLLCITYVKEQNIYGWFKIETEGRIKNICVLTGEDQDDLYIIVERDGVCYIECFEPDFNYSDTQDTARFLDSYEELIHDGSDRIGPIARFANKSLTLYHRGDVKHDIVFDSEGYADIPKELSIPEGDTVVIGYPYSGRIQTLPREVKTNNLDTVGLKRRISGPVFVRVYNTRGLKMGASEDTMEEIKPYQNEAFTTDAPIPLYTGLLVCTTLDESDAESSFLIVQTDPLPAFIQSITTEVDYEVNKS